MYEHGLDYLGFAWHRTDFDLLDVLCVFLLGFESLLLLRFLFRLIHFVNVVFRDLNIVLDRVHYGRLPNIRPANETHIAV